MSGIRGDEASGQGQPIVKERGCRGRILQRYRSRSKRSPAKQRSLSQGDTRKKDDADFDLAKHDFGGCGPSRDDLEVKHDAGKTPVTLTKNPGNESGNDTPSPRKVTSSRKESWNFLTSVEKAWKKVRRGRGRHSRGDELQEPPLDVSQKQSSSMTERGEQSGIMSERGEQSGTMSDRRDMVHCEPLVSETGTNNTRRGAIAVLSQSPDDSHQGTSHPLLDGAGLLPDHSGGKHFGDIPRPEGAECVVTVRKTSVEANESVGVSSKLLSVPSELLGVVNQTPRKVCMAMISAKNAEDMIKEAMGSVIVPVVSDKESRSGDEMGITASESVESGESVEMCVSCTSTGEDCQKSIVTEKLDVVRMETAEIVDMVCETERETSMRKDVASKTIGVITEKIGAKSYKTNMEDDRSDVVSDIEICEDILASEDHTENQSISEAIILEQDEDEVSDYDDVIPSSDQTPGAKRKRSQSVPFVVNTHTLQTKRLSDVGEEDEQMVKSLSTGGMRLDKLTPKTKILRWGNVSSCSNLQKVTVFDSLGEYTARPGKKSSRSSKSKKLLPEERSRNKSPDVNIHLDEKKRSASHTWSEQVSTCEVNVCMWALQL